MTAEQLRDVRAGILRELYRVRPRGRSARGLADLLRAMQVEATAAEVAAELGYLRGHGHVAELPPDPLAPGLDRFWEITGAGMMFVESSRLV